jgi:hypothetical protein
VEIGVAGEEHLYRSISTRYAKRRLLRTAVLQNMNAGSAQPQRTLVPVEALRGLDARNQTRVLRIPDIDDGVFGFREGRSWWRVSSHLIEALSITLAIRALRIASPRLVKEQNIHMRLGLLALLLPCCGLEASKLP